jgi:hypothetical protein
MAVAVRLFSVLPPLPVAPIRAFRPGSLANLDSKRPHAPWFRRKDSTISTKVPDALAPPANHSGIVSRAAEMIPTASRIKSTAVSHGIQRSPSQTVPRTL